MDTKRTIPIIAILFAASFLASCLEREFDNPVLSGNPDTPEDTTVVINPPEDTIIAPPDTVIVPPKPVAVTGITAEPIFLPLGAAKGRPAVAILPRDAANQEYSLLSLDASVVKVSGLDLVPLKAGTALVRARSAEGGFSVEFEAKVVLTDTNRYETQVSAAPMEMVAGSAAMAPVITWTPSDVTNRGYTLSSSAPAKVQVVMEDGIPKCKPLAEGTAQITLRTLGKGLTTVFQATVKPKSILTVNVISISAPDMALDVGAADGVPEPVIIPSFATDKSFSLQSDNPKVASINGTAIHAVSGGTARVKIISADGPSSAFQVTVRVRVKSIAAPDLEMEVGEKAVIEPAIRPADADDPGFTLTSSAPSVAGVNGVKAGGAEIEAKKVGTATMTLASADGGATSKFTVTVVRKTKEEIDLPGIIIDLLSKTGG